MNILKAHVRERGLGLPEDSDNGAEGCALTWKGWGNHVEPLVNQ